MTHADIEKILETNSIKPTANRILVLKELMRNAHPVNLADLEIALAPMDKGSIFRVLQLFSEKEVIHVIEDGSRSLKYEVCHAEDHHTATDQHPHFFCEKCGTLYCLDHISLPDIKLPDAFKVKSINFMIKGICPKCGD
ncbi:MAG: transcriptional repressor [Muribaculaceae bacterium]|nr:transcriptional repressor [Muribaculaceae bacterium]MDE6521644.1 transcriptional repressor [Muribaculaceae bacterium]